MGARAVARALLSHVRRFPPRPNGSTMRASGQMGCSRALCNIPAIAADDKHTMRYRVDACACARPSDSEGRESAVRVRSVVVIVDVVCSVSVVGEGAALWECFGVDAAFGACSLVVVGPGELGGHLEEFGDFGLEGGEVVAELAGEFEDFVVGH